VKVLLVLFVFCLGCLKAFQQPQIGVYLMSWIGYMNPHRLIPWSFIYTAPLAAISFAVTVIGYLFYRDKPKKWFVPPLILLIVFLLWAVVCTYNGFYPERAERELIRFFKILLGIFLTIMLIREKKHIVYLVWAVYLSIGYYGIKGGLFTIATGGGYLVWGPAGTFIEGNNELALALLMILPFGYFLLQQYENKWVKRFLIFSILMLVASALGSHSRGALLALIASGGFLWLKSQSKLKIGSAIIIITLLAIPFLPAEWFSRMETIQTYEQDTSAMGRINAWTVAVNLANDRITAGGFGHWGSLTFSLYAPFPDDVHDAHSIYFEVLGELGYPGLLIFLLILYNIWFGARKNIKVVENNKNADEKNDLLWIVQLNKMLQVSLIAYMSGGAFLGLAYWDLPYHILALVVCCRNNLAEKTRGSHALST
jgi:probable O-glycosylation ligase (exosortase A-associated)